MIRRRRKPIRRSAWSLAECLVVMTIMSVLLGVVVTLLATMMNQHRAASRERESYSALSRLATQFRADARSAESVEVLSASQSDESSQVDGQELSQETLTTEVKSTQQNVPCQIVFRLPSGGEIVYRGLGERIERAESSAGSPTRHETYRLLRGATIELSERDATPEGIVELMVTYPLGVEGKRRHAPIRAALGRNIERTRSVILKNNNDELKQAEAP